MQKPATIIRLKAELWERMALLIPEPEGRGRRPASNKGCFEAIVFLLRTGSQWSELPASYPPKSTVHDSLKRWIRQGIFEKMWQMALLEYDDFKGLDWDWLSADGAITKAPLGGGKNRKQSN
jgi:putative transposase